MSAALPPDVREVSDLPIEALIYQGLRPRVGAQPQGQLLPSRKVIDLPHIRRHSRRRFMQDEAKPTERQRS